jgi:transposase
MIGALRVDGPNACVSIEGATDKEIFEAYVREALCPTLRPGDVVILDNLSSHKGAQALALIAQAGAEVRFLPAYSPDLNPIEPLWSKVKAGLRTAEARTQPSLLATIAASFESVTSQDARNWFAHCGYNFI